MLDLAINIAIENNYQTYNSFTNVYYFSSPVFFITFGLSVILNFFTNFVFSQGLLVNADTCHNFLTHWFYIYILYFITCF